MKTVKELSEGKAASYSTAPTPSERKVKAPPTLLFRRTAIRTFPDNNIVALYYSSQLDKYVSIPFGPEGKALTVDLSEKCEGEVSCDDDQPINWAKVKRKKVNGQLDEVFPAPVVYGAAVTAARVAAAARVAGPVIVRGAAAVTRGAGRAIDAGSRAIRNLLSKRSTSAKAREITKKRKDRGLSVLDKAAIGGAALGAAGGSGSGNSNTVQRDTNHHFDADIGKRVISAPQGALAGASPITNYRQKQNQNYIWNTQTRAGQVQESLNRIIESKKAEIISGIKITPMIAKKLVNLHETLNTENKQNFEKMINENADSLRKVIHFSLRK